MGSDRAAYVQTTPPVPSMRQGRTKLCNDSFDGMMVDRSVPFCCDLVEGHDGPHVELGFGWAMQWGDGVGYER